MLTSEHIVYYISAGMLTSEHIVYYISAGVLTSEHIVCYILAGVLTSEHINTFQVLRNIPGRVSALLVCQVSESYFLEHFIHFI